MKRNTKKNEWLEIVTNNDSYCFFNTPFWYDIHAEYYSQNYQIRRIKYRNAVVLLPAYRCKLKGPINYYNSSAFGTYGNIILDKPPASTAEERQIVDAIFGNSNFDYFGSPFLNTKCEKLEPFTQLIEVENFDYDLLSHNHRRAISRAHENKVEIMLSEKKDDWRKYFGIYTDQTRLRGNLASNRYEWRLFEKIFDLQEKYRSLFLIKEKNEIIGGALIFYFNKASYWHGSNSIRCKQIGGSHLLHKFVIQNAGERGYKIYDFNPSGGHTGVVQFKSGFAAKKVHFNRIEHRNLTYRTLQKIYRIFK